MSDEIKPALTKEEWAKVATEDGQEWSSDHGLAVQLESPTGRSIITATHCGCHIDPEHNHRAAALSLYGQPFGFTLEDAKAVLRAALLLREWVPDGEGEVAGLRSLAVRIAALLPPEEKG